MSAWKLLVKALAEAGGAAPRRQIRGNLSDKAFSMGSRTARRLGLVEFRPGSGSNGGGQDAMYALTDAGLGVVRGTVRVVRKRTPGDGTISGRLVVEAVSYGQQGVV